MESFVAVLHIIVALILIILVLVQDSKAGAGGAFGGGGSNSVFGATGATSLAQQLTRVVAGIFAATCIGLTFMSARSHKSVIDALGAGAPAAAAATAPAANPAAEPTAPAAPVAPEASPTPAAK